MEPVAHCNHTHKEYWSRLLHMRGNVFSGLQLILIIEVALPVSSIDIVLHRYGNIRTLIDTNQEPISYRLIWQFCHVASSTVQRTELN